MTSHEDYLKRKAMNSDPIRLDPLQEKFKLIWNDVTVPAYRHIRLKNLQPNEDKCITSIKFQEYVLKTVRENPLKGFVFFGPSGCGKTTIMTGLKRAAVNDCLRNGNIIYSTTMPDWVIGMQNYFRGGIIPDFQGGKAAMASNNGHVAYFFIDEFDKVLDNNLIQIHVTKLIQDIFDGLGILSLTSNRTLEELRTQFGDHIVRRIEDNCEVIDYFKEMQ